MRILKLAALVAAVLLGTPALPAAEASPIKWQPWSADVFAQAKRENRFVILDLHAVWCHWCHVMDATTYRDPRVVSLLAARYLPAEADQDARPDLANRYEDYGWPATIVFDGDGNEIVKRRGYLPPDEMASMLQAIIDDPTPGPSVQPETPMKFSSAAGMTPERLRELEAALYRGYDRKQGGWGVQHKYLDWDAVEYCLDRAGEGDKAAAGMARETLRAQLQLIDPIWGGVYQYSAEGDWKHPHFEKIMQMQAQNIRTYARAFSQWKRADHLKAARDIQRFVRAFLTSPDGAFYVSMDADLKPGEHAGDYFRLGDGARRKRGLPRVDQHIYARENGWMIEALVELSNATGDGAPLADARRAAEWIIAHRALPGGGFRHDEKDAAGPFLGDTLAMARAFLALHAATGERDWLERAHAAAGFMAGHFHWAEGAGYATGDTAAGTVPPPRPQFDENVDLARFANLLFHFSGDPAMKAMADEALRYLASPDVTGSRRAFVAGVLLAARELGSEPVHVTIVGPRADARARELQRIALTIPTGYRQVECFDPASGEKPAGGIEYPESDAPAAFLCAHGACSRPLETAVALRARLARLNAGATP